MAEDDDRRVLPGEEHTAEENDASRDEVDEVDEVDEASEESFPASDAPQSWGGRRET